MPRIRRRSRVGRRTFPPPIPPGGTANDTTDGWAAFRLEETFTSGFYANDFDITLLEEAWPTYAPQVMDYHGRLSSGPCWGERQFGVPNTVRKPKR